MIFYPKKIKVGYNERKDTYSGKLGYIIYYDQHNKLRKETSWRGWIEDKLGDDEFNNEPLSGFVLNKTIGGKGYSFRDSRQAYCRVYDPRGFEIEIDIENLLYILGNTVSTPGKGLDGEFVYGWNGQSLVLIPTNTAEFDEMKEKQKLLYENTQFVKKGDLEEGKIYTKSTGEELIFLKKVRKGTPIYTMNNEKHYKPNGYEYIFLDVDDVEDVDMYRYLKLEYSSIPKMYSLTDEHVNQRFGDQTLYSTLYDKLVKEPTIVSTEQVTEDDLLDNLSEIRYNIYIDDDDLKIKDIKINNGLISIIYMNNNYFRYSKSPLQNNGTPNRIIEEFKLRKIKR